MIINDLLKQNNMTKYRLAKQSGISQTTIIDICNEKVKIEKCSADTLYKISKALNVSMEVLIEEQIYSGSEEEASFSKNSENIWLGRLYCQAPEIDGSTVVMCNKAEKSPQPGALVTCKVTTVRGIHLVAEV